MRLIVGLLLLTGIFTMKAELGDTLRRIAAARPGWLAGAVLTFIAGQLLSVWKWRLLLRVAGSAVPMGLLVRASLVGLFYNNFLPGSVGGDVAKLLMVAPHVAGKARAAASVFMQRNTGVAGLLVIGLPLSLWWPVRVSLFPTRLAPLNEMSTWFILATAGYVSLNMAMLSHRAYRRFWGLLATGATPHGLGATLAAKTSRLHAALLLARPALPAAIVVSVATQFLDCLLGYLIGRALGIHLPLGFYCVCVPMVSLAQLLPITFNGLGLREAAYLVLMGSAGVSAEAATGLSLVTFALGFSFSLLGGLVHLAGRHSAVRDR